jgi:hypothetical protein
MRRRAEVPHCRTAFLNLFRPVVVEVRLTGAKAGLV